MYCRSIIPGLPSDEKQFLKGHLKDNANAPTWERASERPDMLKLFAKEFCNLMSFALRTVARYHGCVTEMVSRDQQRVTAK